MSDPRVQSMIIALGGGGAQRGEGLDDIRVYTGAPRYQYGQGFGDVLRGIFRTVMPVVVRAGKTLFKTSAAALKDGSSIQESFKSALKPTLRTVLKHGGRALGNVIESQDELKAAPPVEPPLLHQDERDVGTEKPPLQTGSGRYKAKRKKHKSAQKKYKLSNYPNHYNF